MGLMQLLWRNLVYRKLLSLLTAGSIALTVALVVLLLLVQAGVERGAEKGYGPFELVIGADGSESQLALNTFYHIGAPTGNVPLTVWEEVRREQEAGAAFAMTTGDHYNGFPIVGIDAGYFPARYGDKSLSSGHLYAAAGEAVLGAYAAEASGLKVGDTFSGGHGLIEGGQTYAEEEAEGVGAHEEEGHEEEGHEEEGHGDEAHESFTYKVVGILPALHTPDDRAVFTTLDYAWAVHHTESSDHKEVTAVMVKPKSLMGLQELKQKYDAMDNVQAVFSGKAVADVVNVVDKGTQVIGFVTVVCTFLAAITLMLSMIAAANERKRDVGLLRLIGRTRTYVWLVLMGEGLLLTAAGLVAGLLLGHAAGAWGADMIFGYSGIQLEAWSLLPEESLLVAGALLLGGLAALGPALLMYRVNPLQLFRA